MMLDQSKRPASESRPTLAGLISLVRYMCECASANNKTGLELAAVKLCSYVRKGGSITAARLYHDIEPTIGGRFKYNPRSYPQVSADRIFDVLFFAAMMLMDWTGGRFRFHGTTEGGKRYLNLRYEHPSRKGQGFRIYLARIILDTSSDRATPFEDDHHSYRYVDLRKRTPDGRLPAPDLGRAEAIKVAHGLYEERALDALTSDEFKALLTEILTIATAFHGGGAASAVSHYAGK